MIWIIGICVWLIFVAALLRFLTVVKECDEDMEEMMRKK